MFKALAHIIEMIFSTIGFIIGALLLIGIGWTLFSWLGATGVIIILLVLILLK